MMDVNSDWYLLLMKSMEQVIVSLTQVNTGRQSLISTNIMLRVKTHLSGFFMKGILHIFNEKGA